MDSGPAPNRVEPAGLGESRPISAATLAKAEPPDGRVNLQGRASARTTCEARISLAEFAGPSLAPFDIVDDELWALNSRGAQIWMGATCMGGKALVHGRLGGDKSFDACDSRNDSAR